eukprot:Anaeramoba_ignava/c19659_g1_i1.p1 GENE.c19659_g1_i1~~c19659_g1_i1.p1  ORF type:complete len:180 (-),score=36.30 c19659_g1_i1:324-863(-)
MESDKYQLKYINQDSNDTERVECSLTRSLSYNTTQLKEFTSNYSEITQSNRCTKAVKINWNGQPKNVLVIKKWKDPKTTKMAQTIINFLITLKLKVFIEPSAVQDLPSYTLFDIEQQSDLNKVIDFIITIGGDGTVIHACTLFKNQHIPPILAFHYGILGFLAIFGKNKIERKRNSFLK